MITTEQIKELRDATGISIMQCRKALEDAGGDMEKAIILLRKKGAESAAKKAERTLKAGRVASYIHSSGTVGVMVELSSETDFVSGNKEFYDLAYNIAMQIAATNPTWVKKEEIPVEEVEKVKIALLPEVEGKPEAMKEKILAGKLDAFFNERVLLEQEYIKDPAFKIKDLIQNAIQKFGENTEIRRFVRYSVLDK